jgi:hypothetical protein
MMSRYIALLIGTFGSIATAYAFVRFSVPVPASAFLFFALFGMSAALAFLAIARIEHRGGRISARVAVCVLALPWTFVLGSASSAVINNLRLHIFSEQLIQFPLPPGARFVSSSQQVGVLTGNGDHCDFVVTISLASTRSTEAVRNHYASLELRSAIPGGASGGLPALAVAATANGYTVSAVDAPYEGIFDPRCF